MRKSIYIIAEIGINHNGSIKEAFKMVDAAKESGAEIIKHQTHVIEDEMTAEARNVIPGNTDISIYDIMDRCALDEQDEIKLKKYPNQEDASRETLTSTKTRYGRLVISGLT